MGRLTRWIDDGEKRQAIPDPEHDLDPTDWCTHATDVEVNEIGKKLFFTREEAEAKLKEMEESHD